MSREKTLAYHVVCMKFLENLKYPGPDRLTLKYPGQRLCLTFVYFVYFSLYKLSTSHYYFRLWNLILRTCLSTVPQMSLVCVFASEADLKGPTTLSNGPGPYGIG